MNCMTRTLGAMISRAHQDLEMLPDTAADMASRCHPKHTKLRRRMQVNMSLRCDSRIDYYYYYYYYYYY